MVMTAQPAGPMLMSADELLERGDVGRCELVEGELRAMAPAGFEHGRTSMRCGSRVDRFVEKHRLGIVVGAETGFRIGRNPDTVRGPDVAFVSTARLPPAGERAGFLELAPDLAVEVVSPSDRAAEVLAKAQAWVAAGSSLVWVLYPTQRVVAVHRAGTDTVVHLSAGDTLDGGDVLPGFRVPVVELFT